MRGDGLHVNILLRNPATIPPFAADRNDQCESVRETCRRRTTGADVKCTVLLETVILRAIPASVASGIGIVAPSSVFRSLRDGRPSGCSPDAMCPATGGRRGLGPGKDWTGARPAPRRP